MKKHSFGGISDFWDQPTSSFSCLISAPFFVTGIAYVQDLRPDHSPAGKNCPSPISVFWAVGNMATSKQRSMNHRELGAINKKQNTLQSI